MVVFPADVLSDYERFSLYNSPYPAHDLGCAIDLYPPNDDARSPVAGTVLETRTVRCPGKSYAVETDHLILIDCGDHVARILHVEPDVTAGDRIALGDHLGTLVRSGFFGQWVDNHIHLGFRHPDQNLRRASGSIRLDIDVPVTGVAWGGTGTVVETGPTHIQLDSPRRDGESDGFTALAADDGTPLDGGLTHYSGGGVLTPTTGEISLLGTSIGTAEGRDVTWDSVAVFADDARATGLSLFASQTPFGAKIVFHDGHDFSIGDEVSVAIEPTDDPIRLG